MELESDIRLAVDAAGWLESSTSTVQLVLTVVSEVSDTGVHYKAVASWAKIFRHWNGTQKTSLISRCATMTTICCQPGGTANVSGDQSLTIPSKLLRQSETSSFPGLIRTPSKSLLMAQDLWKAQGKLDPSFPSFHFSDIH